MTPQDQVQVAAVLVGILQESGKLSGRIRVQKIAYLLQQKGVPELGDVEFVYHHYGPFAEDVADVLTGAVRTGIVVEKAESFDDEWQRYEYSLGPAGPGYATILQQESIALIKGVVSASKDLHWRILELAATALFLEKRDGGDIEGATTRAVALKPGCRGYEGSAINLLRKLELTN